MKTCSLITGTFRLSLVLGALSLAGPLALAAAPNALTPVVQEESAKELARSCRRIVHLRSGAVFAGVARHTGEAWQVKRRGEWIDIPAGQVLRAPKEAEVLRELKQRRAKERTSPESRLQLARWCASEGLRAETLAEIDLILDARPNDKNTLRFLHEASLLAVPRAQGSGKSQTETRTLLLDYARNAPRAAREVSFEELRKLEDQEALHGVLLDGLGKNILRHRSLSAHALGRLFPGQDARRLLQHAVLDSSSEVRRAAAEALGAAEQPELITPVVNALQSKNPRVRLQAVQALGFMGYPAAVAPLVNYISTAAAASGDAPIAKGYVFHGKQRAYIQDFDVEVATFQAVADPQVNVLVEGEVLEAGVSGSTEYSFATTGRYARSSLQRITGQDAGNTARDWVTWWDKNQTSWEARAVQIAD